MNQIIFLVQIIVGVLLMIVILLQQKGSGLGSTFGGGDAVYRSKRGADKLLFYGTILLTLIFIIMSLMGLFL